MPARRLVAVLSLGLAASGLLGGCGAADPPADLAAAAPATVAPAAGAHLDPPAFASALARPGTTVLDVRTPAEFAQGHLPGAVNVDIEAPDFGARLGALDPAAPYAVYCRSGNRSAAALDAMASLGFTAAYDLSGGIVGWQGAGGEVVTG